MTKQFVVAVSFLLHEGDKILLARRTEHRDVAPNIWEIPAGRMEDGEEPVDTLKREAQEELAVHLSTYELLDCYSFMRGYEDAILVTYVCQTADTPRLNPDEHDELRWVTADEAIGLLSFKKQQQTVQVYGNWRNHQRKEKA